MCVVQTLLELSVNKDVLCFKCVVMALCVTTAGVCKSVFI